MARRTFFFESVTWFIDMLLFIDNDILKWATGVLVFVPC